MNKIYFSYKGGRKKRLKEECMIMLGLRPVISKKQYAFMLIFLALNNFGMRCSGWTNQIFKERRAEI